MNLWKALGIAGIAGIASHPGSAFHPSFHPSSPSVVRVKIVTQLEHDQLTPSGLMVHDHHPCRPGAWPRSTWIVRLLQDRPAHRHLQAMSPDLGQTSR